jgi:hypothetical protein
LTNIETIQNMERLFTGPCILNERRPSPRLVEISDLLNPGSIKSVPYTLAEGENCQEVLL